MSYEAVRESISAYTKANFTGWPLAVENYPYKPESRQPWVRFGVHPNIEQVEEIGGKWERMEGLVWFQIFVPENSGTTEANKIGDALKLLFFQKYIISAGKPTVMCRDAPLRYIGPDEGGWEQWNVSVSYIVFATVP
jgi:hypothetical protein